VFHEAVNSPLQSVHVVTEAEMEKQEMDNILAEMEFYSNDYSLAKAHAEKAPKAGEGSLAEADDLDLKDSGGQAPLGVLPLEFVKEALLALTSKRNALTLKIRQREAAAANAAKRQRILEQEEQEVARLIAADSRESQRIQSASSGPSAAAAAAAAGAVDAALSSGIHTVSIPLAKKPKAKVQATLKFTVKVLTADGGMRDLTGPAKVVLGFEKHVCPFCEKTLKNDAGLSSHKMYCKKRHNDKPKKAATTLVTIDCDPEIQYVPVIENWNVNAVSVSLEGPQTPVETPASPTLASSKEKGLQRGQDVRKSYSLLFKLRVISMVRAFRIENRKGAQTAVSDLFNVARQNVSHWMKHAATIEADLKVSKGKRGRGYRGYLSFAAPRGFKPKYPVAEAAVMGKVRYAIQKKNRITAGMLVSWMKIAMAKHYPDDPKAKDFKASPSWVTNFRTRNNLVPRRPTNKKVLSVTELLPKIKNFHRQLQKFVSTTVASGVDDPEYGRFPKDLIFNVDQSPLCLQEEAKTTIAFKGQEIVQVAEKDGASKRFCTLQVCIALNGTGKENPPQPKMTIIFRGQGKRISAEERASWDPRVHVMFQKKAWVDGPTHIDWLEAVLSPFMIAHEKKEILLLMDNHSAHSTDEVLSAFAKRGVVPFFFPSGCTHIVQPVDHHLAQHVKERASAILSDMLVSDEVFADQWYGLADGCYPAWKCRVLVTSIIGRAWEEICAVRNFESIGFSTGCIMTRSGADRSKIPQIVFKGIENYQFDEPETASALPATQPATLPLTLQATLPAQPLVVIDDDDEEEEDDKVVGYVGSDEEYSDEDLSSIEDEYSQQEYEIDVDSLADIYADPTYDITEWGGPEPIPPAGFVFAEASPLPALTKIVGRKVFWSVCVDAVGRPNWIQSIISGMNLPSSIIFNSTHVVQAVHLTTTLQHAALQCGCAAARSSIHALP